MNKYDTIKALPELKKHYEFLKEVDSISLQKSVDNLADAYDRYYKKQNKQPRFKSKKNPVQSYITKHTNGNITVDDHYIKLPKLGLVLYAKSREVEGRILSATVRKSPSGKYYISLTTELVVAELPKTNSAVFVYLCFIYFSILSYSSIYSYPTFFRTLEEKLVKAQRIISIRKEGGANWYKAKIKVARIH